MSSALWSQGKIADLIMIRGNPLDNVANTANVEIVMKNGFTYTVDDILRPYKQAQARAPVTVGAAALTTCLVSRPIG